MSAARKRSDNREMAELITSAIEAIKDSETARVRAFVRVERVMRRKSLAPTDNQKALYNFIKRQGFVIREWTLGMHFGMLGGLMARGLVIQTTQNGREGVKAI